jgi:hypothetical protein
MACGLIALTSSKPSSPSLAADLSAQPVVAQGDEGAADPFAAQGRQAQVVADHIHAEHLARRGIGVQQTDKRLAGGAQQFDDHLGVAARAEDDDGSVSHLSLRYSSRMVLRRVSVSGSSRYCSMVRSPVGTITSAGMPAVMREATCLGRSLSSTRTMAR